MSEWIAERYRIDRRLGAGASATVFAAVDTWHDDEPVALKILASSEDAYSNLLAREFALLFGLRHPHIPRVTQLGHLRRRHGLDRFADDAPFLVEELCPGEPAAVWAAGRTAGQIATVGAQIAAALAALHARGIQHGDVKPENILVAGGDRPVAKLIDFNLAARGPSSTVSGTLRYMAPEALSGRREAVSDVYALAATLVELLSGAPPSGHHGIELEAPHLSNAIAAMSATDPGRRAGAVLAFELLCAHSTGDAQAALLELRDSVELGSGFVGRQDTVAAIDAALARRGAGVTVLRLAGPPGVGKTALLGEAVARAARARLMVPGAVRSGAAGDVAEVERALQEIGGPVWEATPAVAETDLGAARWQRFSTIADRLAEASADRPIALVFDDVPVASPLDELAAFLERLGERGPRVVWLQSQRGKTARPTLTLEPLDGDAARAITQIARPLRPVDVEAARALHEASGGNPQRLVSLLTSFPGERLLAAAERGDLASADSLRDSLDILLAGHGDSTRKLCTAIALFEPPVPLRLLQSLACLADAVGPEQIERAAGLGLLAARGWESGTAVSVAGEGIRQALQDSADKDLVRELASDLEEAGAGQEHAAELGRLWHRLGEEERAAPHLLAGARCLAARLRIHDAITLYDALISIGVTGSRDAAYVESARLLAGIGRATESLERFAAATSHAEARVGLAETLISLGRYREASEALAGSGPAGEDEAAAEALVARAAMLAGDYDDATRRVEAAFRRRARHPREVELRTVQGFVAFYRGDNQSARRLLEQAAELAPQREDSRLLDASRANLALVLHKSGDVAAAERAYAESLAAARASRDLPRQLLRLTNLAALRQDQGQIDDALAGFQEAHTLARLLDGRRERVRVAAAWANLLCWLGDAEAALERVEEALEAAPGLQMQTEQGYSHLVRAEVRLTLGDPQAAARDVEAAGAIFAASENRAGLAQTEAVRAELAVHRRDAKEARRHAEAAAEAAHDAGREAVEAMASIWRALADLDEPPAAPEAATTAAARAVAIGERLSDPDLGWLAHAAASRLHARAGRSREASLHLTAAHELATTARSRLSARYERTYAAVWYRRELWALVHKPEGDEPVQPGRDLDQLLAINRELAQDHDPDRLLERIIDAAIALSGAERGFIVLKAGPDSDALVVRAARNIDQETLEASALNISRSIAAEAMSEGVPVTSINALDDERFREFLSVHNLRLRSVLCLPLCAQAGPLGALYLDNRYRVNAFSEADVALLSAFGDQAAIALANAQLVTELGRRGRELERSRAEIEELNQRLAKELEASSAELALVRRRAAARDVQTGRHGMIGTSSGMCEVYRVIDRVSDKDVAVTILGESGTGKELVARGIHAASGRQASAFVSINCGAIPVELLESELFGHERGAFTGAVRSKPGLFEVAGNGTILLDEIGDMPLDMQVKLLRVLQQKEYRRVGGTEYLTSNARVLSASNQDLAEMVRAGQFREDLWYRLNVVEIHLPPLRERREDLPLLIDHLLSRHGGGEPPCVLSRQALAILLDYEWPGNVRELENEILRSLALSDGEIRPDALSSKLTSAASPRASAANLKAAVERFERETIRAALEQASGTVAAAARALGLTRAGLYKKLHKYGLTSDKQ